MSVTITLAGQVRTLHYNFAQTKKLKKEFKFMGYEDLIKLMPEEYLPTALYDGCVQKEGLTPEIIEGELTGPDIDNALIAFCTAFFPQRVARLLTYVEENREQLVKKLEAGVKAEPPAETPSETNKPLIQ